MITYPTMNEKIKELLRADGSDCAVYAAQWIEELELQVKELKDQLKETVAELKSCGEVTLESQKALKITNGAREVVERKLQEAETKLQKMEEENCKLRAVAEAVRQHICRHPPDEPCCCRDGKILEALAALDGGRKEE